VKTKHSKEERLLHRPSAVRSSLSRIRNAFVSLSLFCWIAIASAASAEVHRLNSDEMKMFGLIIKNHGQKRLKLSLDPILCKVARQRGAEMDRLNYFDHVNPRGKGPNYRIRRAGYVLPSHYSSAPSGNNIESIALHTGDSKKVFALWLESGPHRTHLLGHLAFYQEQTSIGIGVFRSPNPPQYRYYVFLSAPPNKSDRPPSVILKSPDGEVIARTRQKNAPLPACGRAR
jgi:uncharacterized protein YkwD